MGEVKAQMQEKLSNNPFKGIADVAMQSVQIQWGWAVLVVGAVLLIAAAAVREPASHEKAGSPGPSTPNPFDTQSR
jgi:hypothetical protein